MDAAMRSEGSADLKQRNALPVVEHPDDASKRERVEEEYRPRTGMDALKRSNHQTTQRRANSAGKIIAGSVERNGVGNKLSRNQLRHDGLPRRVIHRRADVQQKVNASSAHGET